MPIGVLRERQSNVLAIVYPVPLDQHRIAFFDAAFAQVLVQGEQSTARLGQQQDAGRIAIEPMYEFKKRLIRPGRAHSLDQSKCNAAAAMRRQSGWLVDRHYVLVFKQDRRQRRWSSGLWGRRPFGEPHRWNAYLVAGRQSVVDRNSTLVHSHFALAHDPIDVTL